MTLKLSRAIKLILAVAIGCLMLGSILFYDFYFNQKLKVIFCDVGQGDAILIRSPLGQNVLIDGGPDSSVLTCLGNNLPFYDRTIDLVILTHYHVDHFVGLVDVFNRYQVKSVLLNGSRTTAGPVKELMTAIENEGANLGVAHAGMVLEFGPDLKLKVIYPLTDLSNQEILDQNNVSVVTCLAYKNTSFLLVGDLAIPGEETLMESGADLKSDVIKIGHHGSNGSSGEKFLQAVEPKIAVISVGQGNKFGHPSLMVIKRLERLGVKVLRTDQQGEIILYSDGKNIWQ